MTTVTPVKVTIGSSTGIFMFETASWWREMQVSYLTPIAWTRDLTGIRVLCIWKPDDDVFCLCGKGTRQEFW
jgi:hypothetical protein